MVTFKYLWQNQFTFYFGLKFIFYQLKVLVLI
jgi:hypothetical protein